MKKLLAISIASASIAIGAIPISSKAVPKFNKEKNLKDIYHMILYTVQNNTCIDLCHFV